MLRADEVGFDLKFRILHKFTKARIVEVFSVELQFSNYFFRNGYCQITDSPLGGISRRVRRASDKVGCFFESWLKLQYSRIRAAEPHKRVCGRRVGAVIFLHNAQIFGIPIVFEIDG